MSRRVFGIKSIGLAAAVALTLAGCAQVTYGTGTGTTAQTARDMVGIFGRGNNCPIAYQPRPDLVPPPTAELPPPGTGEPPPDCIQAEAPI